jgi:hypothetical protein
MCVRKGSPKAVMAVAHHLITVVYQILSRAEVYIELGEYYYEIILICHTESTGQASGRRFVLY